MPDTQGGVERARGRGGARIALRVAALATVAALLTGCAGQKEKPTKPRNTRVDSVTLVMAPQVNNNWPVAVQLVRVNDADLVRELLAIESSAWFAGEGEQFQRANPNLLLETWEIVPGTVVGPANVWSRQRLAARALLRLPGSATATRRTQRRDRGSRRGRRLPDRRAATTAPLACHR